MRDNGTPRARVAVIDDQPSVDLLCEVLSERYRVVGITRDRVSRRRIVESRPDVIIIDLDLRGDEGIARLGRLRSDARLAAIPMIVCSADAYALREHEAPLAAMPNLFVLPKPFSLDDLHAVVRAAVEITRRRWSAGRSAGRYGMTGDVRTAASAIEQRQKPIGLDRLLDDRLNLQRAGIDSAVVGDDHRADPGEAGSIEHTSP